ncbi:hypothetical protein LAZ67_7002806 [Cordylochernes scorpioides]|uniref:Transposase n=1 Tax=Cordylochernes scorpioides TaxID=51811 RepID=A0ABY6KS21_9ARAC|nr:hypothetical protein LAZ67_7002806 [Cordylochernes scorpioides]
MLEMTRTDPEWKDKIIPGYETWVYGYDPETKHQSAEWRCQGELRPKKSRLLKSRNKVLLVAFLDKKGIFHHEYLPAGQTVIKDMYLGILRRLREAIRKKRPEKWINGGWILHHDNARPHTAHLMTSFLAKNGTQILLQPPYFPDIAPNDFFLFPKLKAVLKGRHFDTRDDIIEKSPLALKSIPKEAYKNCFDNWEKRWRCNEGDLMPTHFLGARVNSVAYTEVLTTVYTPCIATVVRGRPYAFQPDSAPSHTARTVQELMVQNLYDHVTPNVWPSSYQISMWGVVKRDSNSHSHNTALRAAIVDAMTIIPKTHLITACSRFRKRIEAVIAADGRVVNGIGKKREAESNGQKFQVDRPRPVRTPATVSKVKRLATTENPPSQRQLSRMCGTSLKTINNIIHKDLELDTRRKGKVHKLTPFHMKNRATNARKLYEEHLAGSRSEYTATLDEAWMYVTYCNGIRKICYIKRGNQVPVNWVHQCSETFPKGFMVVGVMTGRGVLPLIKVPSKVKVNSEFYIECVLKPVIEQLKDLYPGEMDKVFLHHDKASFHTSNKTQQFLQEMKDTLGLNFIRNSDIPVKSPDASPLDFYGFGMLKQRLFNRRPKTEAGLWKAAQEEWSNVSLSKVKEVFAAWKVRCREIAKKKGKHIEHMKKIHVRKIKF